MRICQNGPLDKFMQFLFMRFSTLCIVTYGTIKNYAVQIDSHNSHKLINLTQKFVA